MDPLANSALTNDRLLSTSRDASLTQGTKMQRAIEQLPFNLKDLLAPAESQSITNSASPSVASQTEESGSSDQLQGPEKVSEFQEAFRDFVGQTFFSQMIASMRSTQQEPAYFHGGQAEKIFQGQLDQTLSESLSEKSAAKFADPMFHLYTLRQKH
jgi:peptidoglycan hydrolase FlgJ